MSRPNNFMRALAELGNLSGATKSFKDIASIRHKPLPLTRIKKIQVNVGFGTTLPARTTRQFLKSYAARIKYHNPNITFHVRHTKESSVRVRAVKSFNVRNVMPGNYATPAALMDRLIKIDLAEAPNMDAPREHKTEVSVPLRSLRALCGQNPRQMVVDGGVLDAVLAQSNAMLRLRVPALPSKTDSSSYERRGWLFAYSPESLERATKLLSEAIADVENKAELDETKTMEVPVRHALSIAAADFISNRSGAYVFQVDVPKDVDPSDPDATTTIVLAGTKAQIKSAALMIESRNYASLVSDGAAKEYGIPKAKRKEIERLRKFQQRQREPRKLSHAWHGFTFAPPNTKLIYEELRSSTQKSPLEVIHVQESSPAHRAGLRPGNIITKAAVSWGVPTEADAPAADAAESTQKKRLPTRPPSEEEIVFESVSPKNLARMIARSAPNMFVSLLLRTPDSQQKLLQYRVGSQPAKQNSNLSPYV